MGFPSQDIHRPVEVVAYDDMTKAGRAAAFAHVAAIAADRLGSSYDEYLEILRDAEEVVAKANRGERTRASAEYCRAYVAGITEARELLGV